MQPLTEILNSLILLLFYLTNHQRISVNKNKNAITLSETGK